MEINDKGIVDWRQTAGLRAQGLNDDQICSALGITKEQLAQSAGREIMAPQNKNDFGPLIEFSEEQLQTVKNIIMAEAINGDSSSARLRAASLILQLHSIPASDKYKAAKGLNSTSTINNIMIAVDNAQKLKQATISEQ